MVFNSLGDSYFLCKLIVKCLSFPPAYSLQIKRLDHYKHSKVQGINKLHLRNEKQYAKKITRTKYNIFIVRGILCVNNFRLKTQVLNTKRSNKKMFCF